MASNRDTYYNLSGTVVLLMSELVIVKKNLVKLLKENIRLERVLGQCQQHASTSSGGIETGRGGTPQHKKGPIAAGHADITWGTTVSITPQRQQAMSCTAWRQAQREGLRKIIRNDGHPGRSIL